MNLTKLRFRLFQAVFSLILTMSYGSLQIQASNRYQNEPLPENASKNTTGTIDQLPFSLSDADYLKSGNLQIEILEGEGVVNAASTYVTIKTETAIVQATYSGFEIDPLISDWQYVRVNSSINTNRLENLQKFYSLDGTTYLPLTEPILPKGVKKFRAIAKINSPYINFDGTIETPTQYSALPPKELFYNISKKSGFGFPLFRPELPSIGMIWYHKETVAHHLIHSSTPIEYFNATAYEDINFDGEVDMGIVSLSDKNEHKSLLKQTDGTYTEETEMRIVPNFDHSRDGRINVVRNQLMGGALGTKNQTWSIAEAIPSGEFKNQRISIKSLDEFNASFDPNAFRIAQESAYSKGKTLPGVYIGPGFSLFPVFNSSYSSVPSKAIDFNKDGFLDLFDPSARAVLLNVGDNTFVRTGLNSDIQEKDLNGDGIPDLILFGGTDKKVIARIYKGNGTFADQVLMDANIAADPKVYCADFDRDGHIDILISSSYDFNSLGLFTLMCRNNGDGRFEITESYQLKKWKLMEVTDLDHDGYLDQIVLDFTTLADYRLLLLKGKANRLFESEQLIFSFDNGNSEYIKTPFSISIADVDGDDRPEIWFSDGTASIQNWSYQLPKMFKYNTGKANTAPQKPITPTIRYNEATARVDINWKLGSDAQTSPLDLTYALRIGTTPNQGDIMNGHAYDDGTRRNLLPGNMGSDLSTWLDWSTHAPGTYYVSVQSIDAAFKGSPWSEPVAFTHNMIPVSFTTSATTIAFTDTLRIFYTPLNPAGYEERWDLAGGTFVEPFDREGEKAVVWADNFGDKTITLERINRSSGESSGVFSQGIRIIPNRLVSRNEEDISVFNSKFLIDYDLNGTMDAIFTDGLYDNDGTGKTTKRPAMWNLSLKLDYKINWVDWTQNGLPDLLFENGGNSHSSNNAKLLKQTSKGSYQLVSDPLSFVFTNNKYSNIQFPEIIGTEEIVQDKNIPISQMIDLNNDGRIDFTKYLNQGDNIHFKERCTYIIHGVPSLHMGIAENFAGDNDSPGLYTADFNTDGYWDYFQLISGTNKSYSGIRMMFHPGNDIDLFRRQDILFPVANLLFDSYAVRDLNNDGLVDFIFIRDEQIVTIFHNENNERFVQGENYQLKDCKFVSLGNSLSLFDVDNNGYLDLVAQAIDASDAWIKTYVFSRNETGFYSHGPLTALADKQQTSNRWEWKSNTYLWADIDKDGIPDTGGRSSFRHKITEWEYDYGVHFSKMKSLNTNTPPQVPTGVMARQTDSTLVIDWQPSIDAQTPACHLRYNLSVKRKGASGDGAYIISPLNDGLVSAAITPSNNHQKRYPTATRFEIPAAVLPLEELEIQVQAIDLWDAASDFSQPIAIQIEEKAAFDLPATLCHATPTELRYKGIQVGTPVWDFDGGNVLAGSGFGPYKVAWDTPGVKTILLTTNGKKSTIQTYIGDEQPTDLNFPTQLFCNLTTEFTLPLISPKNSAISIEFELPRNYPPSGVSYTASAGYSIGKIKFKDYAIYGQVKMHVNFRTNECTKRITKIFQLLSPIASPEIAFLSQTNGKNVINWYPEYLSTDIETIIVYKEGANWNDYIEIGRCPLAAKQFVDLTSNTTVKSDRYRIAGIIKGSGIVSPMGNQHRSVHLTINQGMAGQWNLIWNNYEGGLIKNFRILRGATTESLTEIGQVAGGNTSFTDTSPFESTYYAIEYTALPYYESNPLSSPQMRLTRAVAEAVGRTNAVSNLNAQSVVQVEKINILSISKSYELNATRQTLDLYTEIFPINASYQNVEWSIISGENLADITPYGVLIGRPNCSGTVRVQARSTDGFKTIGTKEIIIQSFTPSCEGATALTASPEGNLMRLSWSGSGSSFIVLWRKVGTFAWSTRTISKNSIELSETAFPTNGEYEWLVETYCSGALISVVEGTNFTHSPASEVRELNLSEGSVYPNPVSETLYLNLPSKEKAKQVFVISLNGQVQLSTEETDRIHVAKLANGFYIVRVIQTDNSVLHHRILKQ